MRQLQKNNVELVQSALLQLCQRKSVLVFGVTSSLDSSSAHMLFAASENHHVCFPLWLSLVWAHRTVITEGGTIVGSPWHALA